jgi:hypothetical protein
MGYFIKSKTNGIIRIFRMVQEEKNGIVSSSFSTFFLFIDYCKEKYFLLFLIYFLYDGVTNSNSTRYRYKNWIFKCCNNSYFSFIFLSLFFAIKTIGNCFVRVYIKLVILTLGFFHTYYNQLFCTSNYCSNFSFSFIYWFE